MEQENLLLLRRQVRYQQSQQFNLSPNRNIWISGFALLIPWAGIVSIALLAEQSNQWALRCAALPLIAAFQNHLQILLHEGAHYQLHPKKKWNDFLADLFCAVPFFGLIRHYRHFHLAHHKYLLDPKQDPEVDFYAEQGYFFEKKSLNHLLKMFTYDLSSYHYFQFFISYNRYLLQETRAGRMSGLFPRELLAAAVVTVIGSGIFSLKGGLFLLAFYWLLPQATFLFFFLKLQGYGEHTTRSDRIEDCTLTHDLGLLTRFFIYPLNSELHLEHHMYPSVPWYRLRKIHNKGLKRSAYFTGPRSVLRRVFLS